MRIYPEPTSRPPAVKIFLGPNLSVKRPRKAPAAPSNIKETDQGADITALPQPKSLAIGLKKMPKAEREAAKASIMKKAPAIIM
jgi:hypothetical protein